MLVGQDISVLSAFFISILGISIVMVELGLLSVFVRILSKILGNVSKKEDVKKESPKASSSVQNSVPVQSQNVQEIDDEVAGVMAAVILETGLNPNEVVFKSITKM